MLILSRTRFGIRVNALALTVLALMVVGWGAWTAPARGQAEADSASAFEAAMSHAESAFESEDAEAVARVVENARPESDEEALSLARRLAFAHLDLLALELGPDRALEVLGRVQESALSPARSAEARASILEMLTIERAELLGRTGREAEALEAIEAAIADLPASAEGVAVNLSAVSRRLGLIGTRSPALRATRVIGSDALADPEIDVIESLGPTIRVLEFEAHFCAPCIAALPALRDLQRATESFGVRLAGVARVWGFFKGQSCDASQELESFREQLAKHDKPWATYIVDDESWSSYGLTGIPVYVVVDRDGIVRAVIHGYNPERGLRRVRQTVDRLLRDS